MMVLINIACFLFLRWMAALAHADQGTAFLCGWIAALLADALIRKWHAPTVNPQA